LFWLYVGSDIATFIAYCSIPISLWWLMRGRADVASRWLIWLVAGFVLARGSTRLMSVLTLWYPVFWVEGTIKLVAAVLSVLIAAALWVVVPKVLALPSLREVERLNAELHWRISQQEQTNKRLQDNEAELLAAQKGLAARLDEGSYALELVAEEQRVLFDNSPDALFILRVASVEGRHEFVYEIFSPAAGCLTGRDIQALVGCQPQECFAPDVAAEITAAYETCVREERVFTYSATREVWGQKRVLETSLAPGRDPRTGVITRIIGVARDVTQRVAFEQQGRHIQKMETTGRLAAGFAHDFNNLLQALMGGLEMLVLEVEGAPREFAEIALQSAQRGAELTHRLLAFSRQQMLQPQPVNLGHFLEAVRSLLSVTVGPQITLSLVAQSPAVTAQVDPVQLEAALLNLVINAADAMPGGGRLTLSADRGTPPGEMGLAPGEWAVIAVTDTGSGMEEAVVQQACDPFFTTKGTSSTGLGLSMVQGFVRQSGGDMHIQSSPGLGTQIDLWLPMAQVAANTVLASVPEPPRGDEPGVHVLVVDDADDVLATVAAFLRSAKWKVTHADSGNRALALLEGGLDCDVLVTDYSMPGMNGVDLVSAARLLRPGLPALIITGLEGPLSRYDTDIAVLRKPFGRQRLVREVSSLLGLDTDQQPQFSRTQS
jgi:PAS domain S-box-containing protein